MYILNKKKGRECVSIILTICMYAYKYEMKKKIRASEQNKKLFFFLFHFKNINK
jgi:hypothetical protein